MATFPGGIKSFTNPVANDHMNILSHSQQHTDANDEITAIQTALGANMANVLAYSDSRFKVGTFTRDMTAASGDVSYTGVGFTPKAMIFFAAKASFTGNIIQYFGMNDGTTQVTLNEVASTPGSPYIWSTSTHCVHLAESPTQSQSASHKTFDADGFTLTWSKGGTPSANTLTIGYMAFR
jgi:hypothetical protein